MLGKVFLLGLIGAAAYGASQVMKAPKGAVESGASKAAATIREKAPGLVETVAKGTEQVGHATEKGAQKLRELANVDDAPEGAGLSDIENGDGTAANDTDDNATAG